MIGQRKKEVVLRVEDPDPSHVGRNIVTLDKRTKEALEVTSGDIIEIEGTKKTAAVIWPARAEDEGKGIIRMDNLIRNNSGVALGDKITVRKAIYAEAKRVVLAPTQEVRIIASGYDRILKKNFIGRPLNKGDNVWISVFGSGFVYKVVDTLPRGIVKISDFTQFILKEEPVKEDTSSLQKINYEDIGGLEEQVQKIREMIELPMRHPEIFRKLGINPPKGVLLHGPPGTGKTLLAKAVANETQAHFIAINSPSIMCVDKNTKILTNPSGGKKIGDIFSEAEKEGKTINDGKMKIIQLKKPQTVFCMDKNLKIKKGKITHITKLKAKTYRVQTGLGEEITCSANHPFACMDSFGNIIWKTAKELSKNDLVAVAKTLPQGKQKKFDYLDDLPPHTWIKTKKSTIKRKQFKGQESEVLGVKIAARRRNLKESEFVKLPDKSSPELLRFLGLMYSEGNLQADGLQFSNNEETLKQEFAALAKKLFGLNAAIKKQKVLCYSVTLRNFFEKTLEFPKIGRKGNYSLPKWIFGLTKKETAEFIRGFFEGDGTVSKGTDNYPTIRIYSITRNVLEDLSILCRKIGIMMKIEPWKTKWSNMLALTIVGNKSREIFAEQIKSNAKKYKIIAKWHLSRTEKGDDQRIPDISPLLMEIKQKNSYIYGKTLPEGPTERYISGRDPLTQRKLEEIAQLMPAKELTKIENAELSWTKIERVSEEGEKDLFDLTVEPHSNFLAGHTLLVMHNSKFVGEAEERIRDVFKEAEKNAPSIIFFDEIDSIAPKRDEVIGEVERRVVAQILSAMDGMEARGNVIVIAATNRINAIDEALRRPGRFDREIEIGVPTKAGRKAILSIHTRGMPISTPNDSQFFATVLEKIKSPISEERKKEIFQQYKKLQPQDRKKFIDSLPNREKNEINSRLLDNSQPNGPESLAAALEKIKSIISDERKAEIFLQYKKLQPKERKKYNDGLPSHETNEISNMTLDQFLDDLAAPLHGFVGADLEALAKEAAMKALRRYLPRFNLEEETIPPEVLEELEVNKADFTEALKDVQPSALREVTIEVPNVKWSDIGGLDDIKKELKQAVEWPLKNAEQFKKLGITPPRGVLLYGPPGTGKTLLAKAVATESEANFISVKGPQLISMWVGESARGIRKIFQRARQVSPTIIFFDEIDAIASNRGMHMDSGNSEQVVNQLLTELDGIESLKDVVFIAATNRPDMLDPALLRPGRIDKHIKIGAPDEKARLAILKVHTKGMPISHEFTDFSAVIEKLKKEVMLQERKKELLAQYKKVQPEERKKFIDNLPKNESNEINNFLLEQFLEEFAKKTDGYTGADLEGLLREAALISLERNKMKSESVNKQDIEDAMQKIRPSITKEVNDAYDEFRENQSMKPSYVR